MEPMPSIQIQIPNHLANRLDRIAEERRTSRELLARDLLAGVVDRETERVASELRRLQLRRGRQAATSRGRLA